MRPLSWPALGLVLLTGTVLVSCGNGGDGNAALGAAAGPTTTATPQPDVLSTALTTPVPDGTTSVVAQALGASIGVYDSPVQPEPPRRLANPRPSGAELVFLVREVQGEWLKVLVPVRPNGSTGWVRRADVSITTHDYRIEVEMDAHRITVFKGADVFQSEAIGVGRGNTPTPGGDFYTVELYRSNKPAYGPFAYGLSGFSEVFYDFGGGDGQFGIHGTNDPSGLGSDVSNGCIRMSNAGITKLANELPIGVPVQVKD